MEKQLLIAVTEKGREMDSKTKQRMQEKLDLLAEAFSSLLYEEDAVFLEGMKSKNLAGDDILKYQHWEWTQGVGLYGFYRLYQREKKEAYYKILSEYFDRQLAVGFPALNVNTATPYLAMSLFGELLKEKRYLEPCITSAEWIYNKFPRTKEGGFQHRTSDSENPEELWDDTLFMTVLFLANMGRILNRKEYQEEAEYQFLLHIKYLTEQSSGLFYHGWTFKEKHHFAGALWGRGNCWLTMAIPEFIELSNCNGAVHRYLVEALKCQIETLAQCQCESGMWRTLLLDADAYEEASATCGFGYGILRAVRLNLVSKTYLETARKAQESILSLIDETGILHQVSYGTPMGRDNLDFYKQIPIQPMPYGQALAILYLSELLEYESW